jgi:hypothetical protein
MFEAMVYGCLSIVHERVDSHPWSPLAGQEITWTVPSDPKGIAERVNEILRKPKTRARITQRALDFVTEYSDARALAYMVLEFVEADLLRDPEHPAIFYDNICADPVPVYDYTSYEIKPYVSKHAPKKSIIEEPVEEVLPVEEIALAVPEENGVLSLPIAQLVNGRDGRWMKFITGVARAWIEAFSD